MIALLQPLRCPFLRGRSVRGTLASSALVGLLLGACEPGPTGSAAAAPVDPAREIRELVTALTPPPASAIPVEKSEFYRNRKRALERLRATSPAHGLEALRVFRAEPLAMPEIRAGLLEVAAHTAPEATEPLLVELVTQFGEDLYVRNEATELLGRCRPLRAIEVIEPILSARYDGRTYPPEEQLLEAWITANEALELDPVPFLVLVATDLERPQEVRHLATRALGKHSSPMSRQALEAVLVESSGNGYIRRLALQSLNEQIREDEDFCALAKRIQANEADPEFIRFIESALDKRCR